MYVSTYEKLLKKKKSKIQFKKHFYQPPSYSQEKRACLQEEWVQETEVTISCLKGMWRVSVMLDSEGKKNEREREHAPIEMWLPGNGDGATNLTFLRGQLWHLWKIPASQEFGLSLRWGHSWGQSQSLNSPCPSQL